MNRLLECASRPLPLLPLIGTLALWIDPALATEASIVALSMAWTATVLYNVPAVARVMHTRPTYLEDVERPLETESVEEREMRAQTRRIFNHSVIVSSSVAFGATLEYGMFRYQDSTLEPLELAGVVGGLLSLFSNVHVTIGKVLIVLLDHRRRRFAVRAAKRRREIEMRVW